MQLRWLSRSLFALAFFVSLGLVFPACMRAQDDDNPKPEKHGRKYKAPPETSTIEVTVVKKFNNKPIDGAHVVFHPVKDGVDEGNLEVKTHQNGKVSIDVIPTGSSVQIQVIADGFATFSEDYVVNESSREITIAMQRPKAQISTYVDNEGKESQMTPGVQEPIRPKKAVPAAAAPSTSNSPSTMGTTGSSSGTGSTPQH